MAHIDQPRGTAATGPGPADYPGGMRLAHIAVPGTTHPQLVVVDGDTATPVAGLFDGAPATLQTLIDGGDELLARVRAALPGAESTLR